MAFDYLVRGLNAALEEYERTVAEVETLLTPIESSAAWGHLETLDQETPKLYAAAQAVQVAGKWLACQQHLLGDYLAALELRRRGRWYDLWTLGISLGCRRVSVARRVGRLRKQRESQEARAADILRRDEDTRERIRLLRDRIQQLLQESEAAEEPSKPGFFRRLIGKTGEIITHPTTLRVGQLAAAVVAIITGLPPVFGC